jgi:tripartite-type tricarboxylate transporter receptor subunit TctC
MASSLGGARRFVSTRTPSVALPDIPTVGEFVPGYEASTWYGIGAPKNTPAEAVEKLNKEINAAFADPKMKARLADLGGIPLPGSDLEAEVAQRSAQIVLDCDRLRLQKLPGQQPSQLLTA